MLQSMQLSLGVSLQDDLHFDNFLPGQNAAAVGELRDQLGADGFHYIFLWGREDSGKTHLLRAACAEYDKRHKPSAYVDLTEVGRQPADLSGFDQGLVCIDNLQQVTGKAEWEEALFHLFNRIREKSGMLVIAATAAPSHLPVQLQDLASRLAWGLTYHLQTLQDDEKLTVLKMRARQRGMEMPDEVGRYVLHRSPRRLSGLFALLDTLDEASLKEQRKLTIPFVRQALGW